MNYIILNNDYHVGDISRYFPDSFFDSCKILIVQVNLKNLNIIKNSTYIFPPYRLRKNIFNPFYGKKLKNQIYNTLYNLNLSKHDSLFVFTEIELSNQFIIEYFHESEIPIYLIEDGTATTLLFNKKIKENNLIAKITQLYLFYICNLKNTTVLKFSNSFFYFLPDKYFNGLIQFNLFDIKRNIKRYTLEKKKPPFIVDGSKNSCIFFNQNLYKYYLSFNEYLKILSITIEKFCNEFNTIYFKFHPNEIGEDRTKIKAHISHKNVIFLADSFELNTQVDFSFCASFISTALREYSFYGLKPIYLFHLFDNLIPANLSYEYKLYLQSINYIFLDNLDSLSSYCKLDSFFLNSNNCIDKSTIFPFELN